MRSTERLAFTEVIDNMKTIKVEEMGCEHCVTAISSALSELELEFTVDLTNKQVQVTDCELCVNKALEALSAIGFEGRLI